MRRILVLLTVVALMMVAMMVVMAGAASAQVEFVQGGCLNGYSGKVFGSFVVTPPVLLAVQASLSS
jgi:hypothetical protein